jgi:hypothetical protein
MTYTITRIDALDSLSRVPDMTRGELMTDTGQCAKTAHRALTALVRDLAVVEDRTKGKGRRGRSYRYSITGRGLALLEHHAGPRQFPGVA